MNLTGFTQAIDNRTTVGIISEIDEEIQFSEDADMWCQLSNQLITTNELQERKQKLAAMLTIWDSELREVLLEYHHFFSVDEEEEQGEIDLIQEYCHWKSFTNKTDS